MNKIKYLIVFLFCLCPLWAVGQNQVASGTVSDDLGPLMGVYVGSQPYCVCCCDRYERAFHSKSTKP